MSIKSLDDILIEKIFRSFDTRIQRLTDAIVQGLDNSMYWQHVGAIREIQTLKQDIVDEVNKLFPLN